MNAKVAMMVLGGATACVHMFGLCNFALLVIRLFEGEWVLVLLHAVALAVAIWGSVHLLRAKDFVIRSVSDNARQ